MDKTTLQQLAELRLKDAEALLAAGQWAGAYYMLGYCVECALKACVDRQFLLHEVPERKLVNSFYTHRIDELLTISGLRPKMESEFKTDWQLKLNWDTVQAWSEATRYNVDVTEDDARGMYDAVTNAKSGYCNG